MSQLYWKNLVFFTRLMSLCTFVLPQTDTNSSWLTDSDYVWGGDVNYLYWDDLDEEELAAYRGIMFGEVHSKLNSNKTQEFVSSFRSSFERRTIYQQLLACPFTPLCEYDLSIDSFPELKGLRPCCNYCDCDFPSCLQRHSCCLDILYRTSTNTSMYPKSDKKRCTKLSLKGNDTSTGNYEDVFMNAECPVNTPKQLRYNCIRSYSNNLKEFKDFTPTFDTKTLQVYKNAYCAYCNNVTDDALEPLSVELSCDNPVQLSSEHELIQAVIDTMECYFTFVLPRHIATNIDSCTWKVTQCNITGEWLDYDPELEHACSMYQTETIIEGILYQNIFCALCNGFILPNQTNCLWDDGYSNDFSFSGLLKFGPNIDHSNDAPKDDKCSPHQLFDDINDICRDLFCPPHRILQEGQCSDMFTSIRNVVYDIFLKVVPIETITVLEAYDIADHLIDHVGKWKFLGSYFCAIQLVYTVDTNFDHFNASIVTSYTLKYFLLRVEVVMLEHHDPDLVVEMMLSLDQVDIRFMYKQETSNLMQTFDGRLHVVDSNSPLFDLISDLRSTKAFHDLGTTSNYKLPPEQLLNNPERFAIPGDTSDVQFPHIRDNGIIASCLLPIPQLKILQMESCPVIKLSRNESRWVQIDTGIKLMPGDYILKNTDFYFEGNATVVVCFDVYKQYTEIQTYGVRKLFMSAETIVSIVCSSMSIICLGITLFVFCILPNLRQKLPGKNNMVLVFVLLCAQSMYIVAGVGLLKAGSTLCIAFGMALHTVWLLSMFWMNVCTYHMFHVLTSMKPMPNDSEICRFVVYILYASLMSSIPVTINISLSLSTSDSLGYGEIICYISSNEMVTYTLGVPTAFVIVTNVFMFVSVMVKLKMGRAVRSTVKERSDLIIFAKLSTITGITWVFGFIFAWTDIVAFSYLFILLNAGQGVFIMFAFIFNARVRNMFQKDIIKPSLTSTTSGSAKRA